MKFFGNATKLYIHYHEYEDQENYKNGMKQVKYYHKLEKEFLYKKATWISQTNTDRIQMFASDHPKLPSEILKIMPNKMVSFRQTIKPFFTLLMITMFFGVFIL